MVAAKTKEDSLRQTLQDLDDSLGKHYTDITEEEEKELQVSSFLKFNMD